MELDTIEFLYIFGMYREGYQEQQMNHMQMGYDYRSPPQVPPPYKPSASMEPMPMHPAMYYEGPPGMPPMEPYGGMMPMPPVEGGYQQRYYWREMESKPAEVYGQQYQPPPPPTLLQRISGLIKSQLPSLQNIMLQVSPPSMRQREPRREKSRSRSRSRQKRQKNSEAHDWLCRKCSFSNFDWRDSCKKCKESRPMRGFVPGPEDWKCSKCNNINYARRKECNRCKRPKS